MFATSTTSPLRRSCFASPRVPTNILEMEGVATIVRWARNDREDAELGDEDMQIITDLFGVWLWRNAELCKLRAQGTAKDYSDKMAEYHSHLKHSLYAPDGVSNLLNDLKLSTHWLNM